MGSNEHGGTASEDDAMAGRPAADVTVREPARDNSGAAEGGSLDGAAGIDDRLAPGIPGIEEAGYGYGV